MALLGPLVALLGRFVGRILTTTLGWASTLLFGRVAQSRQIWLAGLGAFSRAQSEGTKVFETLVQVPASKNARLSFYAQRQEEPVEAAPVAAIPGKAS